MRAGHHSPFLRRFRRPGGLDADAVERLYREHSRRLLIYFARRTLDPEAATDLTAETFAVAFRDRRQFRGGTREEAAAWLFGIARHQLSGYYRRGHVEREALRRLAVEPRPLTDGEIERIEELAGLDDMRHRVGSGLRELEARDREILRLRVLEEREYPEIAAELALTEQAARARVSRALRRLRDLVEDEEEPALAMMREDPVP